MTADEFHQFLVDATRRKIEGGVCYWNTSTLEFIFHDEDFDGPEVFGLSILDASEMVDSPLDGYHSSRDRDIDRNEAGRMVAFGGCWWPVGHEREADAIHNARAIHGLE